MRLDKHFGDAGSRAEVAVNLKWRVRIEEFGVDSSAPAVIDVIPLSGDMQQVTEQAMRVIAVEEARPEVDSPSHRPSGGLVPARGQRDFSGGGQVRCRDR